MNGPKRLRISGFEYFDPTGSRVPDAEGVLLLAEWIAPLQE